MRQYIGARYVPKFLGPYDNTQQYEALCVVDNGLGTSYISKVPTPAGTPLTDTTYWAVYGASSGAIINLQNQIGDLTDLDTSNQDSLVDAINENVADIQTLTKIMPYYNVKSFGAVGDGVTDDTQAIQDTIDAVLAHTYLLDGNTFHGGGTVFLPSGTYKITSTLIIDGSLDNIKGVRILGEGNTETVLTSNDVQILDIKGNSSETIEGLILDSFRVENSGNRALSSEIAIEIDYTSKGLLNNLDIRGFLTGVKMSHSGNYVLNKLGIRLMSANGRGIDIGEKCVSTTIKNSYIAASDNAQGDTNGCKGIKLDRGVISDILIDYVELTGYLETGIHIDGTDHINNNPQPVNDIRITNCVFEAHWGIVAKHNKQNGDILIEGCHFDNYTSTHQCVYLNDIENAVICNNLFSRNENIGNPTAIGIYVYDVRNCDISNNVIRDMYHAIESDTANTSIISNNNISLRATGTQTDKSGMRLAITNGIITNNIVQGSYDISIRTSAGAANNIIANNLTNVAIVSQGTNEHLSENYTI